MSEPPRWSSWKPKRIGRRFGDQELLGLLACMRTQDLAIAHDLAAARVQLASGIEKMRLLRHVAPELKSQCASAAAFVRQEDGEFSQAVTVLSGAVQYLDQSCIARLLRIHESRE